MIDIDLFAKILSQEEEGYITRDDFLSKELIKLFIRSRKIEKIKRLFKPLKVRTYPIPLFEIHLICDKCQKEYVGKIGSAKLFEEIRKATNEHLEITCKDCIEKAERERKKGWEIYKEQMKTEKRENTKKFIKDYLDPEKEWNPNISYKKRNRIIIYNSYDDEMIAEHIKKMAYYDFLKTPYWKAISDKVKYDSKFSCNLCNDKENLRVHHRTYVNHGYEHQFYKSMLICLCNDCHSKHHDKMEIK